MDGRLINNNSNISTELSHSKFPKISIVIAMFNGEGYIKPVIRSIQNQNFIFWELIIIDDYSSDNSIGLVKEIMNNDSRILLLKNFKNRGTLYTKTRGILFAKGKYILSLDQDNLYATEDVFSFLYIKAEKNNLELLGFSSIVTSIDIIHFSQALNNFKTSIIKKPNIKSRFFTDQIYKDISSTSLSLYFIKLCLLQRLIKKIHKNILNRNIDSHDDSILIFLLSREANSLLHLKKIFHVILAWPNYKNPLLSHQIEVKMKLREKKKCISYLTFIEIVLLFTESNSKDKELAGNMLKAWFLNDKCRVNKEVKKDAIKICNLFFHNKYIKSDIKNEIKLFFREVNFSKHYN